jgi:hypothetical protein
MLGNFILETDHEINPQIGIPDEKPGYLLCPSEGYGSLELRQRAIFETFNSPLTFSLVAEKDLGCRLLKNVQIQGAAISDE